MDRVGVPLDRDGDRLKVQEVKEVDGDQLRVPRSLKNSKSGIIPAFSIPWRYTNDS